MVPPAVVVEDGQGAARLETTRNYRPADPPPQYLTRRKLPLSIHKNFSADRTPSVATMKDLPDFKDLPPVEGMPKGCAWGLWDEPGKPKDQLGSLNLLTPEVVREAIKEVKTGERCALNWRLDYPVANPVPREMLDHKTKAMDPRFGASHDDIISFNTQASSQWDGYRHWGHGKTGMYYNGLHHDEISAKDGPIRNGIEHWTTIGGIAGRGVLLDYVRYAERHGINYDPTDRFTISVEDLNNMVEEQGVALKVGDILLIRSGYVKWHDNASHEERLEGAKKLMFGGVESTMEAVEWIWNHHFSAVAGDSPAWEAMPPKGDFYLHDYLLAMWGTPLGEMFDCEKLAELCEKQKRYSFFFTSAPLNIINGIASPPNAICIF